MFNNSSSDDDTVVDYNEEIKIVFLGESGVGKSNIINRYNGGQFNPNSVPNNSSFFMSKNLKFGEKIPGNVFAAKRQKFPMYRKTLFEYIFSGQ